MDRNQRHVGEHFITLAVVLLFSASVSYIEVRRPSLQQIEGYLPLAQLRSKPEAQNKPTPAQAAQAQTSPKSAVNPATPASAIAPAPIARLATTNSFAHIRTGKGTSTAIIASVEAGTQLELRDDSDSLWQGIIYQGQPAYIYKSYLNY